MTSSEKPSSSEVPAEIINKEIDDVELFSISTQFDLFKPACHTLAIQASSFLTKRQLLISPLMKNPLPKSGKYELRIEEQSTPWIAETIHRRIFLDESYVKKESYIQDSQFFPQWMKEKWPNNFELFKSYFKSLLNLWKIDLHNDFQIPSLSQIQDQGYNFYRLTLYFQNENHEFCLNIYLLLNLISDGSIFSASFYIPFSDSQEEILITWFIDYDFLIKQYDKENKFDLINFASKLDLTLNEFEKLKILIQKYDVSQVSQIQKEDDDDSVDLIKLDALIAKLDFNQGIPSIDSNLLQSSLATKGLIDDVASLEHKFEEDTLYAQEIIKRLEQVDVTFSDFSKTIQKQRIAQIQIYADKIRQVIESVKSYNQRLSSNHIDNIKEVYTQVLENFFDVQRRFMLYLLRVSMVVDNDKSFLTDSSLESLKETFEQDYQAGIALVSRFKAASLTVTSEGSQTLNDRRALLAQRLKDQL